MEDVQSEFHLEAEGSDAWQVVQIHPQIFRHERGVRQPGEPLSSTFDFENPGDPQSLHWIVTAEGGSVSDVRISIDQGMRIDLPVELADGWSLRYEGETKITVRDAEHRPMGEFTVDEAAFRIAAGRHAVTLDCRLDPEDQATARLEIRPRGRAESVTAR